MAHREYISAETSNFNDIRASAEEFYRRNRVPEKFERVLSEVYFRKPNDVYGYLAHFFKNLSMPPTISRLKGREVYDAGARPTVETEVFCIVCNKEKKMSSATVSSNVGPKTSLDWDAGRQERFDHVKTAVKWINEPLNDVLKTLDPCDQSEVDRILSNFFMAHQLEEEEKDSLSVPEVPEEVPSPPHSVKSKTKKGPKVSDFQREVPQEPKPPEPAPFTTKKNSVVEKPLPPAQPPEPVVPGSLAIGSVSLAVAKTGSRLQDVPLYRYIAALKNTKTEFHMPVVLVTLLSCGMNSPGRRNLLEEVILIPKAGQRVKQIITMTLELQKEMMRIISTAAKPGAIQITLCDGGAPSVSCEQPEQALDLITNACTNLGLVLGTELHLALNCTAPELMDYSVEKYEISMGSFKSRIELVNLYQTLISKYPAVVALIDPFRREDEEEWEKLSSLIGDTCVLLSDVTYKPKAPPLPAVRGHILKHIHEKTISDLICLTSEQQGSVIMGTTSREPCSDSSLADIAVGLGLDYVKLGGLSGAERMAKYNRLISIEEELVQQGNLVSKEKHLPPLLHINLQESCVLTRSDPNAPESTPYEELKTSKHV